MADVNRGNRPTQPAPDDLPPSVDLDDIDCQPAGW